MSQALIQLIKQAAVEAVEQGSPTVITYGTVISDNPLEIQVEDKFTVTAPMILLTTNVIDKETQFSFDNPGISNSVLGFYQANPVHQIDTLSFLSKTKNDITIYNALESGDKVLLLRVQGGQKYIVLDRVVTAV